MAHWADDPYEASSDQSKSAGPKKSPIFRRKNKRKRRLKQVRNDLQAERDNLKNKTQGGKDQKITTDQFKHIVEQYGRAAAERALYTFAKLPKDGGGAAGFNRHGVKTGAFTATADNSNQFLITRAADSKYALNPGATFNILSQTAALIQANIEGSTGQTDKDARTQATGALRDAKAEAASGKSQEKHASQQRRATKGSGLVTLPGDSAPSAPKPGGANAAFAAATTGLFDPAHLNRQQRNSGSLSGAI